jgi:hypothetical protein
MSLLDNVAPQNATNYLVPSSGGTHIVPVSAVFSNQPQLLDWRQFSIDGMAFQPQGAFIDNTQGAGPLVIAIQPIGWNVTVPAGTVSNVQFPSPNGLYMNVTGDGQATINFVDFPVLPGQGTVNIGNTVSVDVVAPNPLPVLPAVNNAGQPYQVNVTESVLPQPVVATAASAITAIVASGSSTDSVAAPANLNLRKLRISISGNSAIAAAGLMTIEMTLDAVVIFYDEIYMPAAGGTDAVFYTADMDFDSLAYNAGLAGDMVLTLGAALTSGVAQAVGYFA